MLDAFARLLGWLAAVGLFTLLALAALAMVADVIYGIVRVRRRIDAANSATPRPPANPFNETEVMPGAMREQGVPEGTRVESGAHAVAGGASAKTRTVHFDAVPFPSPGESYTVIYDPAAKPRTRLVRGSMTRDWPDDCS